MFTTQVQVTTGRPCYDKSKGVKINEQQSIASFFSKAFPSPIEAKLNPNTPYDESTPFSNAASKSISISKGDNTYLHIPGDGKNYELPPNLGTFPLFNIQPFGYKLSPSITAQGGLFLPMYQMEAMWINFECIDGQKFVIRPFAGGVNGTTGEGTTGDIASLIRRMNRLAPTQDYIIIPEQMWLDGISTSPGIVKQFVAAEMAPPRREKSESMGSKPKPRNRRGWETSPFQSAQYYEEEKTTQTRASIEWQVTGRDSVGGIQLRIIPMFAIEGMFAGSTKDVSRGSLESSGLISYDDSLIPQAHVFDVLNTPRDEGLRNGDIFHIKTMAPQLKERPNNIRDPLDEAPPSLTSQNIVKIQIQYADVEKCDFRVDLPGHPTRLTFSLSFEFENEFDAVVAVVRNQLGNLDDLFCMCVCTKTTPNALIPVKSWPGFQNIYHYVRDILKLEKRHRGRLYPYEWKFVWALSKNNSGQLCSIQGLTHGKQRQNAHYRNAWQESLYNRCGTGLRQ